MLTELTGGSICFAIGTCYFRHFLFRLFFHHSYEFLGDNFNSKSQGITLTLKLFCKSRYIMFIYIEKYIGYTSACCLHVTINFNIFPFGINGVNSTGIDSFTAYFCTVLPNYELKARKKKSVAFLDCNIANCNDSMYIKINALNF